MMNMPGMTMNSTPGMDMNMNSTMDMDMNSTMDMDMDMSMHMMMMTMYFNFNLPVTVLFYEWEIKDSGALIGSCVGVAGIGILYELLKYMRQQWAKKMYANKVRSFVPSTSDCCQEDDDLECYTISYKSPKFWLFHVVQTILHMVQVAIAYFLMLIVMAYNVWLAISVVAGAGVGYFITGILVAVTTSEPKKKKKVNSNGDLVTSSEQRPCPQQRPNQRRSVESVHE
uniref:Copper transport protein n=1 Tax=Ciona savignyi TaxID=51511 RepID=H2Z3K9_CIOSA